MSVSVKFGVVTKMLDECASGYTIRLANHFRIVTYNKKVFPTLPKYENIEIGHVRKMVRHLEINRECAAKHFKV